MPGRQRRSRGGSVRGSVRRRGARRPSAAVLGLTIAIGISALPVRAAPARPPALDPEPEPKAESARQRARVAVDRDADPAPEPPPRDPDELPFMPAPYGQPRSAERRWNPPTVTGRSDRRRVAITLVPSFASFFRARFLGRPDKPTAGIGVGLQGDVHVIDPVWLRVLASHSVHPVNDEFTRNDDGIPVQTAAKGLVQATHAGLGVAWGLDLGRVLPLIDVGVGALWIRSPSGVGDGQLGGACLSDGSCDTGLVCSADATCQVGTSFSAHGGVGVDIMLGDHWSAGAGLRYFALLAAPGSFPVYLMVGARLGARF